MFQTSSMRHKLEKEERLEIDVSWFFSFYVFATATYIIQKIVAVKATIDKQKTICKIVVKVGGFVSTAGLLLILQECQRVSYCQTELN